MDAISRKQSIAQVFMELVSKTPPYKKVSVSDVTRSLCIDRKTFYKHFANIDDLSQWIYRSYLLSMLLDPQFSSYTLVKPDPHLFDAYPDWPFYVRIERGDRFLAQELFYKTMAYHFVGNRNYYARVFQPNSCLKVYDYIINLFLPAIKDDILFMLDGRVMPEVAINFLAEYHVMGIFGRLRYHFTCSGWSIMQEEIEPFWNYAHIMLKHSIDSLFEEQERKGILCSLGIRQKTVALYTGNLDGACTHR